MTSDPSPEFYTETLSPLSPVPVHPPESSNILVLRNQIDPVFNMTATHVAPGATNLYEVQSTDPNPQISAQETSSPSSDSNFSDAYKVQPSTEGKMVENIITSGSEVSDDYAMTFDSDGEEQADSQDVSQANIDSKTNSLPPILSELSSSAITIIDSPTITAHIGPDIHSTQPTPSSLAHLAGADTSAAKPLSFISKTSLENPQPQNHSYDDVANGGIDIQQLLDNITANAEKNESSSTALHAVPQSINTSISKGSSGLPAHSSLPPRPQVPKSTYPDDIQKYHSTVSGVPQSSSLFRPPGVTTALIAAGAPGTSTDPRGGLPPPPSLFRAPAQSTASPISSVSYSQINRSSAQDNLTKSIESREEADDIDQRWGPDVQKLYDKFLEDERMYVTEGLWDRFPLGSRLFIGNLPSEKVTKRDLFHVFHKYGKLAQVSIKQAYGFIQFHSSAACHEALALEQGSEVRGRKMHLEISKPQKNTRNAQGPGAVPLRRSRSPNYPGVDSRMAENINRQGRGSNVDRSEVRRDEYGRPLRSRDDYRPARRSPSPLRISSHGRSDYASRGRDSLGSFGRDRGRDRSRSPYSQRDNGRYRERSLSPRLRETIAEADLQAPRRDPRDVPDVQLILMASLDRQFVAWVEGEMRSRGIKTEVTFHDSRTPLEAVIRRQILEGVHAVSQLDMQSQNSSKIALQVFDRQAGADNVRFDEYRDLDPNIAGELVLRAKQTQPPHIPPPYAQPQFGFTHPYQPAAQSHQVPAQSYQPPAPAPANPNLANILGSVDNATLQKLLMSMPQQQNSPAVAVNGGLDLATLLGGLQQQQQQSHQIYQQQPQADPYANPDLISLMGSGNGATQQVAPHAQPQPQQQSAQVQNIMAQLAKFGGR